MSRLWLWCLVTTLLCGVYLATHWSWARVSLRPARALLEPHRIDLGEVHAGVAFQVRLANLGGSPLHVRQVNYQHKALTLNVLAYHQLAPGASLEIPGIFDPTGLRGNFQSTVEIVTDDPRHPLQRLLVSARVQAP